MNEVDAWTKELLGEIRALRDALRFYANPRDFLGPDEMMPDFYGELDFGQRAEAALRGEVPA